MTKKEISYGNVSLDEIDEALAKSETFSQLINNLHNIQRKEGGHRQLFVNESAGGESNHDYYIRILQEIQHSAETNSVRFTALEPRFQELPDGVRPVAKYIASKEYDDVETKKPA